MRNRPQRAPRLRGEPTYCRLSAEPKCRPSSPQGGGGKQTKRHGTAGATAQNLVWKCPRVPLSHIRVPAWESGHFLCCVIPGLAGLAAPGSAVRAKAFQR